MNVLKACLDYLDAHHSKYALSCNTVKIEELQHLFHSTQQYRDPVNCTATAIEHRYTLPTGEPFSLRLIWQMSIVTKRPGVGHRTVHSDKRYLAPSLLVFLEYPSGDSVERSLVFELNPTHTARLGLHFNDHVVALMQPPMFPDGTSPRDYEGLRHAIVNLGIAGGMQRLNPVYYVSALKPGANVTKVAYNYAKSLPILAYLEPGLYYSKNNAFTPLNRNQE